MRIRLTLTLGLFLILVAMPVGAQEPSLSAEPSMSPESSPSASADPSISPEALAEPECVPVDPATLPKGAARFEKAVADFLDDAAKTRERASTASKKQSTAVLQDLWMDAQDFARAVDKIKFTKRLEKAASAMVGRVVLETEFAGTGLAGTKLDPLPDILNLPDGNAAIEEFRGAAGYSWPCEDDASAAEPSPEANPDVVAEGPTEVSYYGLVTGKVDRKATFRKARQMLERLYANEDHKRAMATVRTSSGSPFYTKRQMLDYVRGCEVDPGGARSTRYFNCTDALLWPMDAAKQLREAGSDAMLLNASDAFLSVARTVRSAAVNDGMGKKNLDGYLLNDARQLELD